MPQWLHANLPHAMLVDVVSTAEAVCTARDKPSVAALPVHSAHRYGVPIQQRAIQTG